MKNIRPSMRKTLLACASSLLILSIVNAQTSSSNNVLNSTGVTAIQSITSSYKLSVGGSIKQFGTGDNGTASPTLYLRNTTSGTGRNWGINSGNSGLFQILDSNASNAIRLAINSSGNVGIGTTSPAAPLTVGGTNGDILIDTKRYSVGGVFQNGIWLNGSTTAANYNILSGSNDKNLYINRPSGNLIYIDENDVEQSAFGSGGSLGLNIGFNSPSAKLEINTTSSNDGIYLRNSTTGFLKMMPNTMAVGAFNPLTQAGDGGIIFGSTQQTSGSNTTFGFVLAPWHHSAFGMRMDTAGNIGINKATPTAPLDVNGNIKTTGFILSTGAATGKILVSNDANGTASWQSFAGSGWSLSGNTGINPSTTFIGTTDNQPVIIKSNNTERLRVDGNGRVGIGTTGTSDTAYKLFVETGIRTRKIKVDVTTWSDYVFNDNYRLPTLAEVQAYINQHKHLPDVPSAADVEKNGINVGDNQAVLLKKIEELTLYVIEQQKQIDELKELIKKK